MQDGVIRVPDDIRAYEPHAFLTGSSSGDPEGRRLDIDDIFGKSFERVVEEARRHHGRDYFDSRRFRKARPSDLVEDVHYVQFDGGTLLIFDDEAALIGGFIETDLSVDSDWQSQGLGMELVVEHFMDQGALPTWHLDAAAYSRRGLRACEAAHAFPRTNPDAYFLKAARHTMLDNAGVFLPFVRQFGYAEALGSLTDAFAGTSPGGFEDAARTWIAKRQIGIMRWPV
jgi:hypothetical protein